MYVQGSGRVFISGARAFRIHAVIVITAAAATALQLHVIRGQFEVPPLAVTILGTALAFFVGFINNQAYDRWWEARKIWGAFVNDSRNWALMVDAYLSAPKAEDDADVVATKARLVRRHVAFLETTVARLRSTKSDAHEPHLSAEELDALARQAHAPNAIAQMQRRELHRAEKRGYVDGFRFLALSQVLDRFIDDLGKCERIKTTVFPLGHVYLTRLTLWLFVVLVPMAFAEQVGYWAILFTWVLGVLYIFTFAAGQAIVNPFDNKPEDTPMSTLTRTIEMNVRDLLGEEHGLAPLPLVDDTHQM
jgi:putative membrane protein